MKNTRKLHILTEAVKVNEFEKRNPEFGRTYSEETSKKLDLFARDMRSQIPYMGAKLKEAGKALQRDN